MVDKCYDYEAFGPVRVIDASFATLTSSASPWIWLFHREFIDAESGLYNYGYRHYHPQFGSWPSRDPIGERGGVNLYGFVGNAGVGRTDLLGLSVVSKCPLDEYLKDKGIDYQYDKTQGGLFVYTRNKGAFKGNLKGEIITAMLASKHVFNIKPADTSQGCIDYFKQHIQARERTVEAASKTMSKCGFGRPNFGADWGLAENGLVLPRGDDWRASIGKLLERIKGNPIQMGCSHYSEFSIHVGTYEAGEKTAQYYTRKNAEESDWFPGDRGYIDNTTITDAQDSNTTAEYMIHLGNGKFYGHFNGNGKDSPHDWDYWKTTVDNWTKDVEGDVRVDSNRDSTGAGLWSPPGAR